MVMRWAYVLSRKKNEAGPRTSTVSGGWSAVGVPVKALRNSLPLPRLVAVVLYQKASPWRNVGTWSTFEVTR